MEWVALGSDKVQNWVAAMIFLNICWGIKQ